MNEYCKGHLRAFEQKKRKANLCLPFNNVLFQVKILFLNCHYIFFDCFLIVYFQKHFVEQKTFLYNYYPTFIKILFHIFSIYFWSVPLSGRRHLLLRAQRRHLVARRNMSSFPLLPWDHGAGSECPAPSFVHCKGERLTDCLTAHAVQNKP